MYYFNESLIRTGLFVCENPSKSFLELFKLKQGFVLEESIKLYYSYKFKAWYISTRDSFEEISFESLINKVTKDCKKNIIYNLDLLS